MGLRLERFCYCCTLKTGTLVIGTAGWILTLIEIFILVDAFEKKENSSIVVNDDLEYYTFRESMNRSFRVNWFTRVGYAIVALLLCVLLVVGTYKRDKRFMLPWLVLKCFEACVTVLATAVIFIAMCVVDENKGIFVILTVVCTVVSALDWYTWLCVYSHYRELHESDRHANVPPVYYTEANAPPPTYQDVEKAKLALP